MEQSDKDRRAYARAKINDGGYALLRDSQTHRLGQILDMSRGGLAFCYLPDNEEEIQGSVSLTLFFSGNGFFMENIPVRVVYEDRIPAKVLVGSLSMRKCAIEFTGLDEHQRLGIEEFLDKYSRQSGFGSA
jgi:hypothetical protein